MTIPSDGILSRNTLERLIGTGFVRPNLANGLPILSDNTNWGQGPLTQLIAASDITTDFALYGLYTSAVDQNGEFQLDLYCGAGDVYIGSTVFSLELGIEAKFVPLVVGVGYGQGIPASSRVRGRLSYSFGAAIGVATLFVKLLGVPLQESL